MTSPTATITGRVVGPDGLGGPPSASTLTGIW